MTIVPPDKGHRYRTLHMDNAGRNHGAINWVNSTNYATESYAQNNSIKRYLSAPKGKQFRIFGVHYYVSTLHFAQSDPSTGLMSNINLDSWLQPCKYQNDSEGAGIENTIWHSRFFYMKTQPGDGRHLVHDANNDHVWDAATDHLNPLGFGDWRYYDPDSHWYYPNGIDVGPHLVWTIKLGNWVAVNNWLLDTSSSMVLQINYELVRRSSYRKIFGWR